MVARQAHNLEVIRSSRVSATHESVELHKVQHFFFFPRIFFFLHPVRPPLHRAAKKRCCHPLVPHAGHFSVPDGKSRRNSPGINGTVPTMFHPGPCIRHHRNTAESPLPFSLHNPLTQQALHACTYGMQAKILRTDVGRRKPEECGRIIGGPHHRLVLQAAQKKAVGRVHLKF